MALLRRRKQSRKSAARKTRFLTIKYSGRLFSREQTTREGELEHEGDQPFVAAAKYLRDDYVLVAIRFNNDRKRRGSL